MHNLPHIRRALTTQVWAIEPTRFDEILAVIERRSMNIRLSKDEVDSIRGERDLPNGVATMFSLDSSGDVIELESRGPGYTAINTSGAAVAPQGTVVAVINVMGVISQRISMVDAMSGPGGTSTEQVGKTLSAAVADPSVKAIVMQIDSPGGGVYGVQELADQIMKAKGQGKPIVAQVNSLAASAAYWIASACDEIVVTPSGQLGSIGVYTVHEDVSQANEKAGMKYTFVKAGKYKTEFNPLEPLDPDAQEAMQQSVDSYYSDFTGSVAKGRGVDKSAVVDGFGQGRVVRAKDAVKMGMADKVGTMDQTLKRLASAKSVSAPKAEVDDAQLISAENHEEIVAVIPEQTPTGPSAEEIAATAEQIAAEKDHWRRFKFGQRRG